jgi:hypothetical protein
VLRRVGRPREKGSIERYAFLKEGSWMQLLPLVCVSSLVGCVGA